MRKRSFGTLLGTGLAATVLAIGLAATPSLATAAKTWTVKPGGSFSGISSKVTFRDTNTDAPIICASSSISGKLKSGSGLAGDHIASITAFSFGGCLYPGVQPISVLNDPSKFPYHLNAKSYDASSGETTATVTGIVGAMSGEGCTLTIGGTTDTTPGIVKGEYTNSTHKLQIVTSGSTLHFYNVSAGCLGLVISGDHMTISATYAVTPAQVIKSP